MTNTFFRLRLLGLGPFSVVFASLMLCAMFGGLARVVYGSEQRTRRELEQRFRIRVEIAEPFLRSYVRDLLERERIIGEQLLNAPSVSSTDFDTVVQAFGFEAAVLLDASGKLLLVAPPNPSLLGTRIADRYLHLRNALTHGTAVSALVPSAAVGAPIVGFAARYQTPSGPRVFSGAYDVTSTPLRAYMTNLLVIRSANAYLADASGAIVANGRTADIRNQTLESVDSRLAHATRGGATGLYESDGELKLFVVKAVEGTPWRLIVTVAETDLLAPLGNRRWIDWCLFAAFCGATLVAVFLLLRLVESRGALRAANADLVLLARVDRLTGLPNRRHVEEQLTRLIHGSHRHAQPLGLLMIDVDHFKAVNDSHGHAAGDEVLRVLAAQMASSLRGEDILGRWGGEEFLALLPNTAPEAAMAVAERLRCAVSGASIKLADGRSIAVTVSIGCASTTTGAPADELLAIADQALYRAKKLGRNRVISSLPPMMPREPEPLPAAK
jgi:diguanylate cyclase (GGDEF)-like protein